MQYLDDSENNRKQEIRKGGIKDVFVEVISALFIILFVYTATSKLLDFEKFHIDLSKSPLLTRFSDTVGWAIPSIEILISFGLSYRPLRLVALYACFSLMVMFTAYVISILEFSDYVPCSCGGVIQNLTWNQHLIFNICFVLLAAISIFLHHESVDVLAPKISSQQTI